MPCIYWKPSIPDFSYFLLSLLTHLTLYRGIFYDERVCSKGFSIAHVRYMSGSCSVYVRSNTGHVADIYRTNSEQGHKVTVN